MQNNNEMTAKAAFLSGFLCFIFGVNSVAIKIALTGIGVFTAGTIRFFLASITILLWARYKKINISISSKQLGEMFILTIIFVTQFSCFYNGMKLTTASHGILIANILPFLVLILAHFYIPDDKITYKKAFGIMLGFIGVVILMFDEQDPTGNFLKGDLFLLVAVTLWSINAIFVKKVISRYEAVQITVYPMLLGTPILLCISLLWEDPMIIKLDYAIINAVLFQSIITTAFGFLLWNSLLQRFGATSVHSFIFVMPISGVFAGVFILKESLTPYLFVAMIFIVIGITIVNFKRKRKHLPLV